MRFVTRVSLALAIVIAWAVAVRADEPGSDVPNNLILERFPISKRGDALVVPVRIEEKDHLFLLDTGSNMTVFDPSLPLGEPRGKVQARTPVYRTSVNRWKNYEKHLQPLIEALGSVPPAGQ